MVGAQGGDVGIARVAREAGEDHGAQEVGELGALGLVKRRGQEATYRAKSSEAGRNWQRKTRCPMAVTWAWGSHSTWNLRPRVSTGRASGGMKGGTGDRLGTSPAG